MNKAYKMYSLASLSKLSFVGLMISRRLLVDLFRLFSCFYKKERENDY